MKKTPLRTIFSLSPSFFERPFGLWRDVYQFLTWGRTVNMAQIRIWSSGGVTIRGRPWRICSADFFLSLFEYRNCRCHSSKGVLCSLAVFFFTFGVVQWKSCWTACSLFSPGVRSCILENPFFTRIFYPSICLCTRSVHLIL